MQTQSFKGIEEVLIPWAKGRRLAQNRFFHLNNGVRAPSDSEQIFSLLVERPQILVADGPFLRQCRVIDFRKVRPRPEVHGKKTFERSGVQQRGTAGSTAKRSKEFEFAKASSPLETQGPPAPAQARFRALVRIIRQLGQEAFIQFRVSAVLDMELSLQEETLLEEEHSPPEFRESVAGNRAPHPGPDDGNVPFDFSWILRYVRTRGHG